MKYYLILLLFLPALLFAQEYYDARSDHFQVRSTIDSENAAELTYRMEQLYAHISIHLDITREKLMFPLLRFRNKEEYIEWQNNQYGTSTPLFQLRKKSSLTSAQILVYGDMNNPEAAPQLAHLFVHQLIQELNPQTPDWLRWGLAVYYEKLSITSDGFLIEEDPPYQSWIIQQGETYPWKSIKQLLNLKDESLLADPQLKAELWLLTNFLMEQASSEDSRILWENIRQMVQDNRSVWPGEERVTEEMEMAFQDYRKTLFNTALTEIRQLYSMGKYSEAQEKLNQQNEQAIYSYYRGLIFYKQGEWEKGIEEFQKSLDSGSPQGNTRICLALCYWQLGELDFVREQLNSLENQDKHRIPEELMHLVD